MPDDLLEEDDPHRPTCRCRQYREPRQSARDLHNRNIEIRSLCALSMSFLLPQDARPRIRLARQKCGDVQRLVPHKRKRPRGIHRGGREDRKNLFFKIPADEGLFLLRQLLILDRLEVRLLLQRGNQHAPVRRILQVHKLMCGGQHSLQLRAGRHAGDIRLAIARVLHILQTGDTDHEKFIQIGACDRQEFKPLEQLIVPPPRLSEHPLVKLQPGKLPVDVISRISPVGFSALSNRRRARSARFF